MKKILLINGSPRLAESATLKLARAFIRGYSEKEECLTQELNCYSCDFECCRGCLACWRNNNGECVLNDGFDRYMDMYLDADIIIWSFPNYYYGMPARAKAFMERLLPMNQPFMIHDDEDHNQIRHPQLRERKAKEVFLFCSGGFGDISDNMKAISDQFDMVYKDQCTKFFFGQGELLKQKLLEYKSVQALSRFYMAGKEYAQSGKLKQETINKASEKLVEQETYINLVNARWGLGLVHQQMTPEEIKRVQLLGLVHCMPYTYEPDDLKAEKGVLEIHLKDLDYVFQLHMDKQDCKLIDDPAEFTEFDLKLNTDTDFLFGHAKKRKGGRDDSGSTKSIFYPLTVMLNRAVGSKRHLK